MSFIDPAISDSDSSHGWSQQQRSMMGQQQSWGHGNPALASDLDAPYYQVNAPDGPGGRCIHQEYYHEQGGASGSMMSSQSAHQKVPSLAFNGLISSSMRTPEYYHQPDATAGSQMTQNASVVSHGNFHQSHEVDPGHFDLVDDVNMELLNIGPERPPWSAYQTAGMRNPPYPHEEPTITDWQHTSETTFSTTDREGSGSGYIPESCTPLSSRDYVSGSMLDSTITERPDMGYTQYTDPEEIPPDCPPSWHISQMDIDDGNYVATMENPSAMESFSQYGASLVAGTRGKSTERAKRTCAKMTHVPRSSRGKMLD
ncbi:hypothetical protein J4E89_007358 [Alternaria sp. Ai002NY15]|nr:hypothetical protein J4E89_007358 [Alternaria sp. Ai002NY15]